MAKSRKRTTAVKSRTKSSLTKSGPRAKSKPKTTGTSSARSTKPKQAAVEEAAPEVGVALMTQESEISMVDYTDVSEEKASIVAIVRSLEGQVETAFKLKDVLATELDATQEKLAEQMAANAELEAQVPSLEAQAALAERLREDVSYAEQERNKFANLLAETQPQLKQATEQRDSLLEELSSTKDYVQQIETQKTALEAQLLNLKDEAEDAKRLRAELNESAKDRGDLAEQLQKLSNRLETFEKSNATLKRELAEAHDVVGTLRAANEGLQGKLESSSSCTIDLRDELEQQQLINNDLMEAKIRLEGETKMATANYGTAKTEVEALKKALRYIRSEATRTSGRVRQRYQRDLK